MGRSRTQAAAARTERSSPSPEVIGRYEARSIKLLQEALERVAPDQRGLFWRNYVQADSAFRAMRQHPGLRSLQNKFATKSG